MLYVLYARQSAFDGRERDREKERERERELLQFARILHNSYLIPLHMHIGTFWSASCNKWNQSFPPRREKSISALRFSDLMAYDFSGNFFAMLLFHNISLSLSLSLYLSLCSFLALKSVHGVRLNGTRVRIFRVVQQRATTRPSLSPR